MSPRKERSRNSMSFSSPPVGATSPRQDWVTITPDSIRVKVWICDGVLGASNVLTEEHRRIAN